jgi:hypothetical protein
MSIPETDPATQLRAGDPVTVTIPGRAPNCIAPVSPVHVRVLRGVYLGIPRFETTIAQVRIADQVARMPLEYLAPATEATT